MKVEDGVNSLDREKRTETHPNFRLSIRYFELTWMAAPKRSLEDSSSSRKAKKVRVESDKKKDGSQSIPPSKLQAEEVDFPRGGGTSFTPLEVKAIRAEAVKEANAEIFTVGSLISFSTSSTEGR